MINHTFCYNIVLLKYYHRGIGFELYLVYCIIFLLPKKLHTSRNFNLYINKEVFLFTNEEATTVPCKNESEDCSKVMMSFFSLILK